MIGEKAVEKRTVVIREKGQKEQKSARSKRLIH